MACELPPMNQPRYSSTTTGYISCGGYAIGPYYGYHTTTLLPPSLQLTTVKDLTHVQEIGQIQITSNGCQRVIPQELVMLHGCQALDCS